MRLRAAFVIPVAILLIFPASASWADSIEESYARTVQTLNQEGFAGIDKALSAFEGMIAANPGFVKARLGAADAYPETRSLGQEGPALARRGHQALGCRR